MEFNDTLPLTEVREEPSQNEGERESSDDKIILRIVGPHQTEMNFRIKASTSIEKLKKTYSERTKLPMAIFQLHFDGRPIANNDTPQRLKMNNLDEIQAVEQYPAYRRVCLALENLARHSHHFKTFIENGMTDDLVESCLGAEVAALDKLFVKLADRLQFTRAFKLSQNYQENGRLKPEPSFTPSPSPILKSPGPCLAIRNSEVKKHPGQEPFRLKRPCKTDNKLEKREKRPRYTLYSLNEIKEIVKYVCEYQGRHKFSSLLMWKEAERAGKFPGRSAGALHLKFLNSILPNLKSFDWLSSEDLTRLEHFAEKQSFKSE